jgi:transcriptional regulator with XRE-family HTH domain
MQRHRRAKTPEQFFGVVLRQVREEKGITQEKLAFESGYHPTYIGQIERGVKNPSLRTIMSLAAVLKEPAAELVRRVEALVGHPWQRPERSGQGSAKAEKTGSKKKRPSR